MEVFNLICEIENVKIIDEEVYQLIDSEVHFLQSQFENVISMV